jgi:hypothetical protein
MDPAHVAVHMEEDRSHWRIRGRLAVIRVALRRALPSRRMSLLERVFALERHLAPRLPLPFGASLLLIGRR